MKFECSNRLRKLTHHGAYQRVAILVCPAFAAEKPFSQVVDKKCKIPFD